MVVALNPTSIILTNMTLHDVAAAGEENTAYTVGSAIGKLIGLKRMVELTFDDLKRPLFSKDELMNEVETVINKLNTIEYPYKIKYEASTSI